MSSAILCVDDEVIILESLLKQFKCCFDNWLCQWMGCHLNLLQVLVSPIAKHNCHIAPVTAGAKQAWKVISMLNDDGMQILANVSDYRYSTKINDD